MAKNRHKLSRHIPNKAKAEIRRLCGFGCVICGGIPYDYDHFETEFHDCKEHDINDIVLLCDKHHREKDTISIDVIKKFLQDNPVAERDVVFSPTILTKDFRVEWPSVQLIYTDSNIVIDGEEVLKISSTGNSINPMILNGVFYDDKGIKICEVENNEFRLPPNELGEFTCEKYCLEIKAKSGRTILKFRMAPGLLKIEKLYLIKNRAFVIADEDEFLIGNGERCAKFENSHIVHCKTGVHLESTAIPLVFDDDTLVLPRSMLSFSGCTIFGREAGLTLDQYPGF